MDAACRSGSISVNERLDSPVERYADEYVARKEESEDLEEGEDPAEDVARRPHHGGGVPDLQRHHQERHLKTLEEQRLG